MSNERIDLTQFEGISPAKEWGLVYPERPQRTCVQTGDGLYHPHCRADDNVDGIAHHPHCRADDIEVRRANMALMAAGPDLIAELKRCYERIDYLESVAEEYRQERPEEYCANCYAYLSEYDGDGVKECLCSDCEASE